MDSDSDITGTAIEPVMAQHALDIGPCHCRTGRQRYRIGSSVSIPWDARWDTPSPFQAPNLDPESDSSSDLDIGEHQGGAPNAYPSAAPNAYLTEESSVYPIEPLVHIHGEDEDDDEEADDDDDVSGVIQTLNIPDNILLPVDHQYPLQVTDDWEQFIHGQLAHDHEEDEDDGEEVDDEDDVPGVIPAPSVPVGEGFGNPEVEQFQLEQDALIANPDPGDSDPGDSNVEDEFPEEQVPDIACYRLNLTALSQRYNIYAVAYGDVIHICRVRSCVDHALPARPDLILRPPRSKEAAKIGGHLDTHQPHQMNHLIMGDLGDEEILLLACDDGDVLAYYNSHIETALMHLQSGDALNNCTRVKPFFHQNVGKSAWGLAIHKKSRLIAVGNNSHQVHVFAMALTDPQYTSRVIRKRPRRNLFLSIRKSVEGELLDMSELFGQLFFTGSIGVRLLFRQRQDSYRFILETGERGNNIPNVAFSSNPEGDAVDVLAVDISGKLWVLDIWSMRDVRQWYVEGLHVLHSRTMFYRNPSRRIQNLPRGWGVLVLPESSFLPTNTFRESLGLNPAEAVYVYKPEYGYYIGTEKAIKHIKDNSTHHPWVRQNKCHRFNNIPNWDNSDLPSEWYDIKVDCEDEWTAAQDEAADESSEQPLLSLPEMEVTEKPPPIVTDGSSVMRTYEMGIELIGGDPDNAGIMFTNAIYQKKPPQTAPPGISFPIERLANLLHVPELSLVVAGSLCGRVVLITLTRPTNPHYSFKRGFRIEAILPKRTDEDRHLRPICPLLGVAIGPIPSTGGRAPDDHLLGERRYRVMLHYYDHRILSYEVYRNMMTSELSVI
ncbi:hypothetical protein F5B21DRAFT_130450 [Xylaria acuta]|nr:hypothetical protein F5B21DRAFT_130450 [Xylaria acuta]